MTIAARRAMANSVRLQTVRAPDPERRTSPILDEVLEVDVEPETRVCYFNDATFAPGEYVCCGNELLQCEERGVWVRKGPCRAS
jgi:hypothetical protein